MSYKHNNLMAMRQNFWNDVESQTVEQEKNLFADLLNQHDIFKSPTLDDAKYLFFSLPSIIIVKGYAVGFTDQSVKVLIEQFIIRNKVELSARSSLKIEYKFV